MKDETLFKGSQLETEIRITNYIDKLKKVHQLTSSAFENQPNSIFWKEAFEMINKKINYVRKQKHQCAFTEVYLKNHGWQKLLTQGEQGTHEGLRGIYYLVNGFGKVHEKYCEHFR